MTKLTAQDAILIAGFCIVFIVGVLGNMLVCYIFKKKKKTKYPTMDMLIFYLALIDLISSIVNPTLYIYWQVTDYEEWHFGKVGCKTLPLFSALSIKMSIGLILLITLDRARVICKPMQSNFTKRQARIAVIVVFIVSVLTQLPYAFKRHLMPISEVSFHCRQGENRTLPSKDNISHNSNAFSSSGTILNHVDIHFKAYVACSNIVFRNITTQIAQDDPRFQLTSTYTKQVSTTLCRSSCVSKTTSCNPPRTSSLVYLDVSIIILQDVLFVLVFTISTVFIYLTLYDKEHNQALVGQQTIKPKKTIALLLYMAAIFAILVFPKDIFYCVFQLTWLDGKNGMPYDLAKTINGYLKLLQTSNCVCNVFIYAKVHSQFKMELVTLSDSIRSSFRNNDDRNDKKPHSQTLESNV